MFTYVQFNVIAFLFLLLFIFVFPFRVQGDQSNTLPPNYANIRQFMERTNRLYQNAVGVTKDEKVPDKEYDFIIVGAGSAGSVLANRLSEIAEWSVLLIEAGKEEIMITDIPLLVTYILNTDYNWNYKIEPTTGACLGMRHQRCKWPRGKGMGGSSIINYMVYTRGFKSDYDNWASLGNKGWSYEEVLPYFLKSEDIKVPKFYHSKYHSRGGYLKVEQSRWQSPIVPSFLKACQESGYNMTDPNNAENFVGCSMVMKTTDHGARCSASKAFLRPIRARKNLHVSKETRVTKVLIDPVTKRAYGVEMVRNRRRYYVRARKEVILSAGTLNSPQLLMLSGVGPGNHLKDIGIDVIENLNVGYNLQDHVSMAGLAFLVNQSVTIVENRFLDPRYMFQYLLEGSGPYTIAGGAEAVLFTKTKYCEKKDDADMELVFGPGSLTGDTGGSLRDLFNIGDKLYENVYRPYLGRDGWTLVPILLRPRSRGYLKLKSKNPFQPPLFYPNYFSDERDLRALVEGVKMAVKMSTTKSFQKYSSRATLLDTAVPECKHLPIGSDEYWMCTTRYITTTLHHQVGTCKMGPESDPEAVVDPELKVRGISRLRVVDASIMPVIPAGHTNSVVMMIAEKASDMIKSAWLNRTNVNKFF